MTTAVAASPTGREASPDASSRPLFTIDLRRIPVVATSIVLFVATRLMLGRSPALALATGLWLGYCAAYLGIWSIDRIGLRGRGAFVAIALIVVTSAFVGRGCEIALWAAYSLRWSEQAIRLALHLAFVGLLIALPLVLSTKALRRQAEIQAERSRLQARLLALQAQIEPHFLFNTLATLRALIRRDGIAALDLLDRTTQFLRAVLPDVRRSVSTVAREIAIVEAYLAIMQCRLAGRLAYSIRTDPLSASARMPPLLLQPLVENAVAHGIEPAEAGGVVEIVTSVAHGLLIVEVRNTGDPLNDGAKRSPGRTGHGLGLDNVRARIAALSPRDGSFSLVSAPDGATVATVRLPVNHA